MITVDIILSFPRFIFSTEITTTIIRINQNRSGAQQVKLLTAKHSNLTLIPRTHMVHGNDSCNLPFKLHMSTPQLSTKQIIKNVILKIKPQPNKNTVTKDIN